MDHTTIAVDVAKSVFEVAVSDRPGHVSRRERLTRGRFLEFFANRPATTVLMEACGSAHHWSRQINQLGHKVVLLPAHCVRRYVMGNKTDRGDAKALLEAYRNDQIRPVPVKTINQQALVSLHRIRSGWMATRTARLNTVRGLLREFGITIAVGARQVLPRLGELLEDAESAVPDALRGVLFEAGEEIRELERKIRSVERQLKALAHEMPLVGRLQSIPGIGLLTSTALVAFVGDAARFPTGRHLASYLGLTPRERSSGLVRRLGRISKRGDAYLRMLLIHGARAVLWHAKKPSQQDRLRSWGLAVEQRRGHNKAAAAVANKLARICWAVWTREREYTKQRAA